MAKTDLRRKFCSEMGWKIVELDGAVRQVIGADGVVLVTRHESYLNGYLDGLRDGMIGTPWVRSRRRDGSR